MVHDSYTCLTITVPASTQPYANKSCEPTDTSDELPTLRTTDPSTYPTNDGEGRNLRQPLEAVRSPLPVFLVHFVDLGNGRCHISGSTKSGVNRSKCEAHAPMRYICFRVKSQQYTYSTPASDRCTYGGLEREHRYSCVC